MLDGITSLTSCSALSVEETLEIIPSSKKQRRYNMSDTMSIVVGLAVAHKLHKKKELTGKEFACATHHLAERAVELLESAVMMPSIEHVTITAEGEVAEK